MSAHMPRWQKVSSSEYDRLWLERMFSNCKRLNNGCLIWLGNRAINGYGQAAYRAKNKILHRKVYEVIHGITIDRWIYVCHSCDVKLCCEPSHLWLGTPKENSLDAIAKGTHQEQRRTHCLRGHPLSGDNLIMRKQASGKGPGMRRVCRSCERIRYRMAMGWTFEQASTLPITPHGQRPVAGRKVA